MPIENIASYDFTKNLNSEQIFGYLKNGLVEELRERYSVDVVGENYLKLEKKDSDCLIYEMNDKLYPGIQLAVVNNSDCFRITYVLTVTPFNVFIRKPGLSSVEYNEDTKSIRLTKIHRKVMKEMFGELYVEAKEEFIDEVKDVQLKFAQIEHDNLIRQINEKHKNDLNC